MIAGAQSIYRTMDIIETLLRSQRGLSVKEIAGTTGISLPTAHRILNVLRERGFVRQEKATRLYYTGDTWLQPGSGRGTSWLRDRFADLPGKLVERFGDTAYLLCRHGYRCLCLERAESSDSLQVFVARPGSCRLLGDGAETFGILGFLAPEEQDAILRMNLPEFRDTLLRPEEELREEVMAAGDKGFSFGEGFRVAGTVSVAVPIHHEGRVAGTVALSGMYNAAWIKRQPAVVATMLRETALRSAPAPG